MPNDSSQIIYVWLDALVNYLTVAGYPNDKAKFASTWPADVHVVGKDILKFHVIYWPAFLFAANIQPPKRILCHGHWLIDNKKMSKSIGNVIDPSTLKDKYTTDGIRYFLLRDGVPSSDNNISTSKIQNILNSELSNTLGNLYQRCASASINKAMIYPSYWNIATHLDKNDQMFLDSLDGLRHKCNESNENFNFFESIQKIMAVLRETNALVEERKPWVLVKNKDSIMELQKLIFIVFEVLRISGILLQPITPRLATKLLDYLNVDLDKRGFDNAIADKNSAEPKTLNFQASSILFKKI